MRRSRYTVDAAGSQGEHLLYNISNGAFARLDDRAYAMWRDNACEGACAEQLAESGFLTELSADDELARQRGVFDRERADTTSLTLSIVPTYVCNFRCPYCYELGHNKVKGTMDERTMDAIMSFIQSRYDQDNFGRLAIQWYGGDPSLALDKVEQLSQRMIAWADERGVAYEALMLTNANVIDEDAAHIMVEQCRISMVFLTIDGPEEVHNRRRVAANGSNSYERTIEAARYLRMLGVRLAANMNADKVNIVHYEALRKKLLEEEGIELSFGKLNDYGHFFGEAPFCSPDFDLFTHEEFFQVRFDEFAKQDHNAGEMRELLRPTRRFCTGQLDNYFVIDLLGDVYSCDGWVGDTNHKRFNIFDDPETWLLHDISFDATRDELCSTCAFLPVCMGNCIWERECSGMPCHPFKTTIGDYLRLYAACLNDGDGDDARVASPSGVTMLAEPFSARELGWE